MTDDEFEKAVERWHTSDTGVNLHEYLGMTWEEYAERLRIPPELSQAIAAEMGYFN